MKDWGRSIELGEKLLHLRATEGERRGLGRSMTQTEVAAALRQELGLSLSQAYLSQIEGGKRVHLSNKSREALARFFRVHPGYLVNDPPSFLSEDVPPARHPYTSQASPAEHGIPGFALVPGLPGMPSSRPASHSLAPLASPRERREQVAERNGTETARASAWSEWSDWTTWPGPKRQTRAAISSAHLESLLSRLRDHPDAERVLLVIEQTLTLSRDQLDTLSRELTQLTQRDETHRSP
ncbi:MAG: helix-turn-helix domain-containing protein [Ktedonobacterales bacterium]